jgi:hypothetical protein
VDSRAASASQNADACAIWRACPRSHSARACADTPSENSFHEFPRRIRIRKGRCPGDDKALLDWSSHLVAMCGRDVMAVAMVVAMVVAMCGLRKNM